MDKVKDILEQQEKLLAKYKPITVEKHLEVRNDVGMLMCSDPNDLEETSLKINKEEYLTSLTRDNVQLLINDIWELPTEQYEECIVAKLPKPETVLPRLRKVPGPKVLTKWEKFAMEKGIKKKRKDKKVFDKELQKWVPTYGFKRREAENQKDWVIEVPKTADPMEDMFQKKIDLRAEKVAKNEIQRMKNIARAKKVETPRAGYLGPEAATAGQLNVAATIAKASTASVGKFQEKLQKDKPARGIGVPELIPGKKRKASHIGKVPEKEQNLDLIKSILNKKPKLDVDKAVSLQKREAKENPEAAQTGATRKKSSKSYRKAKGMIRKSSKKPKGGKGQRAPQKKPSVGRKRR